MLTKLSSVVHCHNGSLFLFLVTQVFTLPNLRPHGKYKLTAYTGSKVRRVGVTTYTAKSDPSYKEHCLTCLCNSGDFHILSLPDLRRQMDAQSMKKDDIQ